MTEIHPTAVVADGATLGEHVKVGPYCVVGPEVTLGDAVELKAHVVVEGWATLGDRCRVFPFACIGTECQDLKYKGDRTAIEIGADTTLREYVTVNAATNAGDTTHIGSRCFIMAYSHIAHACWVGDEVIMANAATLGGESRVDDQAIIGGLSGVHQFCRVGRLCMVGGCTKVTKDLPPFMLVDGNPARVRGVNLIGMERRGIADEVRRTMRDVYRLLYRSGQRTSEALAVIEERYGDCEEVRQVLCFMTSSKRGVLK